MAIEITTATILSVVFCGALGGDIIVDKINDAVYEALVEHKIDLQDYFNGQTQEMPPFVLTPDGDTIYLIADELALEEWKLIPHIQAVDEYARGRTGLNYYWTKPLNVLNQLYMNWLHSIPTNSPLHENGRYAETFVEMHLVYFQNGLLGRINNTF